MQIEFEAKVVSIEPSDFREQLSQLWATCTLSEIRMNRVIFDHPAWWTRYLRIRDEWECITLTAKDIQWSGIEMVHELETTVWSFATMHQILEWLGMFAKSYQETKREIRTLGSVTVMIDQRPRLPPFAEIEWPDKQSVQHMVERLWYAWSDVVFGAVDELYHRVYGIPHSVINACPRIQFDLPCPF